MLRLIVGDLHSDIQDGQARTAAIFSTGLAVGVALGAAAAGVVVAAYSIKEAVALAC